MIQFAVSVLFPFIFSIRKLPRTQQFAAFFIRARIYVLEIVLSTFFSPGFRVTSKKLTAAGKRINCDGGKFELCLAQHCFCRTRSVLQIKMISIHGWIISRDVSNSFSPIYSNAFWNSIHSFFLRLLLLWNTREPEFKSCVTEIRLHFLSLYLFFHFFKERFIFRLKRSRIQRFSVIFALHM